MAFILIQNGTLVTATDTFPADVLIRDEQIVAIGRDLAADRAEVIDASGCYVLPGVVDPHVHIQLDTGVYRTADDWRVGTATAALGGVTTVIDFATQFPGQDAQQAVASRHRQAGALPHIDYALHCMLTGLPEDDAVLAQWMADLRAAGVSAIKVYTTYRPHYYQGDASLLRAMRAAAAADLVVMVHAENDAIVSAATAKHVAAGETSLAYHGSARPLLAEVEAVHRCLFLADEARCELYVVHCSAGRSVELITAARVRGQRVHAETCPQYLLLDERLYKTPDAWRGIMQPPLRDPFQPAYLWQLLADGRISSLGSDHCDYTPTQKLGLRPVPQPEIETLDVRQIPPRLPFTHTPGGIPGLQTALPLLVTHGVMAGHLDWPGLVRLMSTQPARIFRLYPRKGNLAPGADADLVIYDPRGESKIADADQATVGGYTPYAGIQVKGRVRDTLVRGQFVVCQGQLLGAAGWGRYVPASGP